MDPLIIGLIGIAGFLVLLVAGVHIGIAMGAVGVLGLMSILGVHEGVTAISTGAFYFVTNPEFVVLPMFVLMGLAAMQGGISEAAFEALSKLLGRLPGGLGIASVAGCSAFGTVCGSSMVTAIVFTKVACPEMRRHGYEKRFSYGIISSAGIIGMLIPPSSLAVIYGLLTQESISKLLIAGIGPGILMALLFCLCIVIMVLIRPQLAPRTTEQFTWGERLSGFVKLWPVLVTAIVVIGGIYGGIFTVGESGAFGTFVILIIAFLWGKMKWSQLWNALAETVSTMAMVFLILTAAKVFSRFIVVSGLAQNMMNMIVGFNPSTWQLLLALMLIYVILGCFLDSVSMLSITIPIIYPLIKNMGIEPMWFAMIVILSIEAGLITPPFGLNVYGVKSVAQSDVSLGDIFLGSLPFLIMVIIVIIMVIAFPAIANWLPLQMLQTS